MGRKSRAKHSAKPPVVSAYSNKKEVDRLVQKLVNACVKPTTKKDEWENFLEIQFLVERIRQYQTCGSKLSSGNRMEKMEAFKQWLEENGAIMNNVVMEYYGGELGIGLKATFDLKKDDKFIEVPYKIMMTSDKAKESYLGNFIKANRVLSEMSNVSLSLYLHCERFNPESFFKPYIDILPTEYNTTLYFSTKEMEFLKGSPSALSAAISQYKSIARQYGGFYNMMHGEKISPELQDIPVAAKNEFTFDAYRWAVASITTRLNRIPTTATRDGEQDDCEHGGMCHGHGHGLKDTTLALIPLWDMMNHSPGPMSTDCDPEKQFCMSYAMKDFKKDEQVTIFYGGRNNIGFLVHNGFVVARNPADHVDIQLGVSTNDKLYQKRVKLLEKLRIPPSGSFQVYQSSEKIPASPDLLAFLRVFHMSEEELDSWCAKDLFSSACLEAIYMPSVKSRESDSKLWKFLENRMDLLLRVYKPTDEEENEILADPTVSEKVRLTVKYHREMKKILADCREFCHEFPVNPTKYICPINEKMISELRREGLITDDRKPRIKQGDEVEGGGERDAEADVEILNAVIEDWKPTQNNEENQLNRNGAIENGNSEG